MTPRRADFWSFYPQTPTPVRGEERGYLSAWHAVSRGRDAADVSNITPSSRAAFGPGWVGSQFQFTGAEFTFALDWSTRANTTYECWLVVLGSTISSAASSILSGSSGNNALIFNTTLLRLDVAASTRINQAITGAVGDSVFLVGESNNYKLYHRAAATGVVTLYTGTGAFGGVTLTSAMQRTSSSLGLLARWTNRTPSEGQIYAYLARPWTVFQPQSRPLDLNTSGGAATHTTTGALAADAAVVAGAALHPHTTTGALAAQAAVVAGAALHPHTTTGALAADAAVVAGTAAHITLHATTGALAAGSAVVSGDARDETQYLPPRNTGAGKSKRKKRERLQVEVDGEVFDVASRAEAEAVLEQAKEQAQKVAEQAIERATKAKRRPVKKVLDDARNALQIPAIAATPELSGMADDVRKYIEDLYSRAFETIEIAAHLARREREDEDDEDLLLLLL